MTLHIVFVDNLFPDPAQGYGFGRAYALIDEIVRAGCSVEFIASRGDEAGDVVRGEDGRLRLSPSSASLSGRLAALGPGSALMVSRPDNLKLVLSHLDPESKPLLIYDCEALRYRRRAMARDVHPQEGYEGYSAQADEAQELALIRRADLVVCVSEEEKDILSRACDCPVVRIGSRHDGMRTDTPHAQRNRILLLGGFFGAGNGVWSTPPERRSPNHDAALFFFEQVVPHLPGEPRLDILVAGVNARRLSDWPPVQQVERVTIMDGYGDPVLPYRKALCLAAPTRYAAGLAFKLTESLAYGVPVVTTPVLASELGAAHRDCVLVADTGEAFAQRIVSLARDAALWSRKRDEGLGYIESEQSALVFSSTVADLLRLAAARLSPDV